MDVHTQKCYYILFTIEIFRQKNVDPKFYFSALMSVRVLQSVEKNCLKSRAVKLEKQKESQSTFFVQRNCFRIPPARWRFSVFTRLLWFVLFYPSNTKAPFQYKPGCSLNDDCNIFFSLSVVSQMRLETH